MSENENAECRRNSWWLAIAGGVIVFLLLAFVAQFGWFKALVIGAVFCIALGLFLIWAFCSSVSAARMPQASAPPQARPTPPAAAPAAKAAPAPAPQAAAAPLASSTEASVSEERAKPKTLVEPLPKASTASALNAALAKSKNGTAKGTDGTAAASDEPLLLAEPRGGKADDLKMIKGVGPALEKVLNSVGVWHFDQIAAWTAKDIALVEDKMDGFRGRISRDGWVKQAKELAKGGSTEFSERVKKGGVY